MKTHSKILNILERDKRSTNLQGDKRPRIRPPTSPTKLATGAIIRRTVVALKKAKMTREEVKLS